MVAAASSTLSPPTSLNNSPSKRDVLFVPSSDSEPQGPIDDLLAAEMGKLVEYVFVEWSVVNAWIGQICSTCLDNHVSEVLARLLKCLVKASGKFLEFISIVLASFLNFYLNQVARVYRKGRMLDE